MPLDLNEMKWQNRRVKYKKGRLVNHRAISRGNSREKISQHKWGSHNIINLLKFMYILQPFEFKD